MNFEDIGISDLTLKAIQEKGYNNPTPIQEKSIPYVLQGRDVLGCAQTGTGKTASFTLPLIDILAEGRARARMPRSLILEPTRELAAQVSDNIQEYSKYHKLSTALLIGGESFSDQEKALDKGVDILIATPGRLLDLFERGKILLSDTKILVIDEADRMLDMGFIPDIERIVSLLPPLRQTLFFSATMAPEIRKLADQFLQNPKEITVNPPSSSAQTITQNLCLVAPRAKRAALRKLLEGQEINNAIVFCNRKKDVSVLDRSLNTHGWKSGALHGDMPQHKRMETLEAFKNQDIKILVASDVAARGLDIPDVSHVFNYDPPIHAEDYVHRIGRTGRAGREGVAFTLAMPDQKALIDDIEKTIGKSLPMVQIEGLISLEWESKEEAKKSRNRKSGQQDAPQSRGTEAESGNNNGTRPQNGRNRRQGQKPSHPQDDAPALIGFGDHVPAFILRQSPIGRHRQDQTSLHPEE